MEALDCKNVSPCGKNGLNKMCVRGIGMTAPARTSEPMLCTVKKIKNLTLKSTMSFNRRALGFLWNKRNELDPSQSAMIQAIMNNKKKGSLEGCYESTYKLSKSKAGTLGYGRLYGSKGSFERLKKECRGTVCKEFYHDIDVVNAHPVFLVQFAKANYNKDLVEVQKYVENRDSYLAKISDNRDEAKEEVIRIIYGGKPKVSFMQPFYDEVHSFTKFLMFQQEFEDLKEAVKNEDNVYGSFLSYLLQTVEREIMLVMKTSFEQMGWAVDVLCYDGIMVRKNAQLNLEQSLRTAEQVVAEQTGYNVKLLDKELIGFDIPESKEEIVAGVLKDDYLQMKAEFEINHFYFVPTNQYAEMENGIVHMYDLNHATEYFKQAWRFQISDKFNDFVEFFKIWRDDPTRKCIKSIDYKPTDDPFVFVPPLDFAYKSLSCEPNEQAVEYWKTLIRLNTNNNEILYNWVMNYFAHMLQKPFELPKTALVFTGDKGSGKDTPVDFIMEHVLGKNFTINYQSNHQFFDHYDCGRANKFLVKLEEADRKACLTESSYLKSLITADKSTFNPKGKTAYQLPNYNRFIFTTNKANPMEIDGGERRFVILGCSAEKKGNHEFWKQLREAMFCESGGLAVANYLLSIDLSSYNVRNLPENEYMKHVIESEKSSEDKFVEEWDGERISSADLYREYKNFCFNADLPMCKDSAVLGKLLLKHVRDGVIKTERGAGNKNFYWKA